MSDVASGPQPSPAPGGPAGTGGAVAGEPPSGALGPAAAPTGGLALGTPTGAIPVPPAPPPPAAAPLPPPLPLDALHDVELHVEVVLGRARMPLRDLLGAHPGTTIELDRSVHSPVDVMVNGTLFARAEMVVVDDSEIGVQVVEVVGIDVERDGLAS